MSLGYALWSPSTTIHMKQHTVRNGVEDARASYFYYIYSLPCHGLKDLSMLKQVDVNMAV